MKKIKIYSLFLSALLLLASCQEEEKPNLGRDTQWLQFGEASYVVTENSTDPLVVDVLYGAETNPDGVTVNFTVVGDNPSAYTISPADGTLEIPAGEFVGQITITPIDNAETDGNKEITISLDNDDIPLGIAGEGKFNTETTVTITDNDCELDMSSFEGTYLANEFGYCDGCYEVSITYDAANDVLVLDNLYETGGTTYIGLDNSDPNNPKVNFRSRELGGVLYVNSTYGDVWATNPSGGNQSSFRTCDQFMDLVFRRCVSAGCFSGTVRIQLTKI
ncbi:hypothetical protein [Salinimicrobium soli]|uniref:hypothetical protein n=1 Tax=Salinimicrobium soli TaxID=1254399 RepID=UPI003AAB4E2F